MSVQRDAEPAEFARTLITWQRQHGRHDLPWQRGEAYGVWVSEIMLQQTQVQTVIGYYARFMTRFPTLQALAAAEEAAVMEAWSGLGYYARARNLLRAAREIMARFGGAFPGRSRTSKVCPASVVRPQPPSPASASTRTNPYSTAM